MLNMLTGGVRMVASFASGSEAALVPGVLQAVLLDVVPHRLHHLCMLGSPVMGRHMPCMLMANAQLSHWSF